MSLTLITGRVNSGKTGELHAALRTCLSEGRRAVLLLPSVPDVERAAKEFRGENSTGLSITTLDAWIAEIWALFGDGRRLVSDSVRPALLRQSLCVPGQVRLATAVGSPGFLKVLEGLARQVGGAPGARRDSGPELSEVSKALSGYKSLLSEYGYIELVDAVAALPGAATTVTDLIVANRFTDLSVVQEEFLLRMADTTEVCVSLPWESGFPATEALDPLVERLSSVGRVRHVQTPRSVNELDRLEQALYGSSVEPLATTGSLVLAEAAGEEAEIALAARIVAAEIEKGRSPDRIALVFRDMARRRDALVAAFRQASIPLHADISYRLRDTEFGAAILTLLEQSGDCVAERVPVSEFLLSPYSFATADAVQALEARWRSDRTRGRRLIDQVTRELGPSTGNLFRIATRLMAAPETCALESEWQDLAGQVFAAGIERFHTDDQRVRRDAAAHRAFCRAATEVSAVPGLPVSPSDMLAILGNTPVHDSAPDGHVAVLATEAHRLRSRRFDVVVIGGMTAQEFSETPQTLGSVLASELGVRQGGDERLRERLLFYSIVSRAKSRLVLLRQVVDSDGRGLRASIHWDEVTDLYDGGAAALPLERLTLVDVAEAAPAFAPGRLRGRQVRPAPSRRTHTIDDEEILSALASTQEFSVTELETYLACPRRWFHERVIRPRELAREFDAREAGGLAHRTMARFYELLPVKLGSDRVVPAILEAALELADHALAEAEQASVGTQSLSEEQSLAQVRRKVRAAISRDAELLPGMSPVVHELPFGDDAGLSVDVGGVRIRGRIDRVDRSDRGVLVTDYKAGSVYGRRSFHSHGLIQVPLYAYVAGLAYQTDVLGGVYRSLASGALRGFWLADALDLCDVGSGKDAVDKDGLAEVIEEALISARDAADRIRAGSIEPAPGSSSACVFCALKTSCGVAQ